MRLSLLLDAWLHAARAIRADKGRSAGVVLGVAVATAALTMLSVISASGQRAIIAATGGAQGTTTVLEAWPEAPAPGARQPANPRPIDGADLALVRAAPSLRGARVAARREAHAVAVWQGEARTARVLGVSPELPRLLRLRAARGRLLAERDAGGGRRAVVLGAKFAEQLPGDAVRPGDRLRLDGASFQVVGILEPAPSFSSGDPWDWDGSVLMTDRAFLGSFDPAQASAVDRIFVGLAEAVNPHLEQARAVLRRVMSFRHGGAQEIGLDDGEERKRRLELVLHVLSALLLISAAVSLGVSSLNVMNATLISTTERCYEIGLRRSLGASRLDVFWQFVVESAVLSTVGAALGLGAGALLLLASHPLVKQAMPAWRLTVAWWGPAAAVLVPVLVSALFTLYPAWRGAALDPVTALRRR